MKNLFTLLVLLFIFSAMQSQAPLAFQYQAVVRGSDGKPMANQEVSVKISLMKGHPMKNTPMEEVYVETHELTTNGHGLVSLAVGQGERLKGDLSTVQWGEDTYFMGTGLDLDGSGSYVPMGMSQLLSVPYAFYANSAKEVEKLPTLKELAMMSPNGEKWKVSVDDKGELAAAKAFNQEDFVNSLNDFGIHFLKEVNKGGNQDTNILISPVSLSLALSMTANGAVGPTRDSMFQALHFKGFSNAFVNNNQQSFSQKLQSPGNGNELFIANSLWPDEGVEIEQDFLNTGQNYYEAGFRVMDLQAPGSKDTINNWVYRNTAGKIEEIVDEMHINCKMLLVNAVYFNGVWKTAFPDSATAIETFYLKGVDTLKAAFMKMADTLDYFSNDLLQMISLPYAGEKLSMVAMLPREGKQLDDVLKELNAGNWKKWNDKLVQKNDLQVKLPRFSYEFGGVVNGPLKKMGMGIAFGEEADFSKITGQPNIWIHEVNHKTAIEVNESGTEAAAATDVELIWKSPPPEYFIANKPFLYAIKHDETNAIIFLGKMMKPAYCNLVRIEHTDIAAIYPNPVKEHLNITFTLAVEKNVLLQMYDIKGQVKKREEQVYPFGQHTVTWEMKDFVNGIYLLKVKIGEDEKIHKILINKDKKN